MARFKLWNNIAGVVAFLIAITVYLLTLEPTASLWDCGEFIASSYKLQVGHPPGAPFFLLLTKVFSLITSEPSKVAWMVNAFSALAGSLTILFLFWTITHIARKIILKNNPEFTTGKIIVVIGAGLIGSLACAFSDTFWFSAVEGEVYASSSLFTALVFWAILKWEDVADEPYANRWIILIAYLMGLSIGVHLLNLLAIPAIMLVYYFRKYKLTFFGLTMAVMSGFIILFTIQYLIIPGVIYLASRFELVAVNVLGLPYNSGVIIYFVLLSVTILFGIVYTRKRKKVIANTILLGLTVVFLGYTSYALIIIRAQANTSLNENAPKDVFSLLYYLNRDQYGDRPLIHGQYYNAPIISYKDGKKTYTRANNKYIVTHRDLDYIYDSRFTTFFPRIYSRNKDHIQVYKDWADIKGTPLTVTRNEKQEIEYRPSFSDNFSFFVRYQLGYMYFRYFLWNFAGKQNDLEGNGGNTYGNWLSGIKFVDRKFFGPQEKLPDYMRENKGRNKYYLLPLVFGLLGLIYQIIHHRKSFMVVSVLFVMTGIAIVIYLNQTPLQARERDYAYAGSFYAYSIWIGLGVLALFSLLKKMFKAERTIAISIVAVSFLAVPLLMATQNRDDHDRSGRYFARNIAFNYLQSCAQNAILFTVGDNDTFPLWYLQEVEGIRTDVRVVNLTLLSTDWYIEQMKRKIYDSDPLPISFNSDEIRKGKREYIYFLEKTRECLNLKDAISFVRSDDPSKKLLTGSGEIMDYFPTRDFMLPVDTLAVLYNGAISSEKARDMEPFMTIKIKRSYISKNELIVMDILANNNWKRPVYFVAPYIEGTLGMDSYLRLEGFAYRLVPIKSNSTGMFRTGSIEPEIMYRNLMHDFKWEGINNPDILMDAHYRRTFASLRVRANFARLAEQLYSEGKKDSAYHVIKKCFYLFPQEILPHDAYSYILAEACYKIGLKDKARQVVREFSRTCSQELAYYEAMPLQLRRYAIYETAVAKNRLNKLKSIVTEYDDH